MQILVAIAPLECIHPLYPKVIIKAADGVDEGFKPTFPRKFMMFRIFFEQFHQKD
jgi:hypothetical protein